MTVTGGQGGHGIAGDGITVTNTSEGSITGGDGATAIAMNFSRGTSSGAEITGGSGGSGIAGSSIQVYNSGILSGGDGTNPSGQGGQGGQGGHGITGDRILNR
ncbi:hypothetical protein [Enterobacter ludwigii]|uniref:hypothetical protein n=1 Tax=Enterobacter ludwigii TaxID=299767 RepID=UPI0039756F40